ncbi:unnamed protein product, partial [Ectocarpus sp. 8 AP-2014]
LNRAHLPAAAAARAASDADRYRPYFLLSYVRDYSRWLVRKPSPDVALLLCRAHALLCRALARIHSTLEVEDKILFSSTSPVVPTLGLPPTTGACGYLCRCRFTFFDNNVPNAQPRPSNFHRQLCSLPPLARRASL